MSENFNQEWANELNDDFMYENIGYDDTIENPNQSYLISEPLSVSTIKEIYNPDNEESQKVIDECISKYPNLTHLRRVIGDGNCFIRGFTFQLLKYFLDRKTYLAERLETIHNEIEQNEGDISHLDIFYESFIYALEDINDLNGLESLVNNESRFQSIIWWQRMIASNYIKTHKDDFLPYIQAEGYTNIKEYCESRILPLNLESENIFILALCEAFGVRVEIIYIDSKQTYSVTLPDNDRYPIIAHFLFRPGHYDLLEE